MMGNTWDGGPTKRIMGVAADFVQYLVNERSDEPATMERVAARFSTIIARGKLPARRATRKWREVCRRAGRAAEEWWQPVARRLCVLQMRRVGWLGEEHIASQWPVGTCLCGTGSVAQRLRVEGRGGQPACRGQAVSSCQLRSTLRWSAVA